MIDFIASIVLLFLGVFYSGQITLETPAVKPSTTPQIAETSIEQLICQYPWPCQEAIEKAYCESKLKPDAQNLNQYGEFAGLFQIHRRSHESRFLARDLNWSHAYIAKYNIEVAFEIWNETKDWRLWAC